MAGVTYHPFVDSRHARGVVTWRPSEILVPVITAAMALTLVSDLHAPGPPTAVEETCPTSLQSLINSTPVGGTLDVPACVYRETVTISRPITINGYGAVIDGRDAAGTPVRAQWLFVSANDVTVRGFTMRYAAGTNATGSVENAVGVQRFVLEDCDIGFSYVNVNLTGAIDSVIRNCSIHDAKHLGVRVSAPSPTVNRGQRNALIGNRIFHNDRVGEPDPGADGGNLKASGQDYLTLNGNEVFDSGVGLWLDVWCRNSVISNNRVHHNDTAGIHDETSTGTKVFGNAVWKNGFGPWGTWGWGAGILIHSSKGAEVYSNVVAWNNVGISVIEEDRGDSPGVTGTYVHDNVVAEEQMSAGNDHFGLFWAYSLPAGSTYQPIIYLPASNNRGFNNRFWYPAAENSYPRFIWDGYQDLASFVTVPGGTGSSYVSATEKSTALSSAGVPATP